MRQVLFLSAGLLSATVALASPPLSISSAAGGSVAGNVGGQTSGGSISGSSHSAAMGTSTSSMGGTGSMTSSPQASMNSQSGGVSAASVTINQQNLTSSSIQMRQETDLQAANWQDLVDDRLTDGMRTDSHRKHSAAGIRGDNTDKTNGFSTNDR